MEPEKLLSLIEKKIESDYPFLGVNKKREVIRLFYEIAKIKRDYGLAFVPEFKNYAEFKKKLLKIRYPKFFKKTARDSFYLPALKIDKENVFSHNKNIPAFDAVFYEEAAEKYPLVSRLKKRFPDAVFNKIRTLKEDKKKLPVLGYSDRKRLLIVTVEKNDFIKTCPCTQNCVSCGYFVFNLGFGCPFECSYCYLQGYQNINAIILPANLERFFEEFDKMFSGLKNNIRIGTGEFSDSLAFDDVTEYSNDIVDFFEKKNNVFFEFKTKSVNIENILKKGPRENIAVSFSLSPKEISVKEEFFCAKVEDRIKAMKKLYENGHNVAFHLDPIIYSEGFEKLYEKMLLQAADSLDMSKIKWVSLGTFRFHPDTKKIIENRFPESQILDGEMFLDFDGKLRYHFDLRFEIYQKIISILEKTGIKKEKIYLCMENSLMWEKLKLNKNFNWS